MQLPQNMALSWRISAAPLLLLTGNSMRSGGFSQSRGEDEPRGIEFGDLALGNMFVGTIVEKGADVTEYEVGDRVCSYGPIKETQIVNAVDNYKLRKMSKEASAKNAVCYDPAQFALSGIRDADVRPGDRVVVIGLGAIGQIALQFAAKIGATTVIGIDPIAKRREIAEKTRCSLQPLIP